jgi:hypothetical protein
MAVATWGNEADGFLDRSECSNTIYLHDRSLDACCDTQVTTKDQGRYRLDVEKSMNIGWLGL